MNNWLPAALCSLAMTAATAQQQPFADVHLHWKWNQQEVTSPAQAIDTLRRENIGLAVVTGTPPALALELQKLAPDRVVPIYGIYRQPGDWLNWHRDDQLVERVRTALASGDYHGIGEIHMIGGFISHWRKPSIAALFQLAAEFDVPVLLHTEFSRADYTLGLCQAYPQTRFLWAHSGAMLDAEQARRVLAGCPNVHAELSARDPWRHRGKPISDADGQILDSWRQLVIDYPDRFMVGSDPVWPVERLNPWDEPDSGWEELPRFVAFHRGWLATLPEAVERAVRWGNAQRYFRRPAPAS